MNDNTGRGTQVAGAIAGDEQQHRYRGRVLDLSLDDRHSNGLDERVHRTFREELPITSEVVLYEARTMMLDYRDYYNHRRPRSALKYLCPADYYRGDPVACLAEREAKLQTATAARVAYW